MRIGSALAASCAALIATAAAEDAVSPSSEEEVPVEETAEDLVEATSEDASEPVDETNEDEAPLEEATDLTVSDPSDDPFRLREAQRVQKRQQERDEVRSRLEAYGSDISKWRLSSSVAFANAEIEVIDSEIELPDDFAIEDLDLEIPELTSLSSTLFVASAGYRVLPFLELTGQIGYLNSETATPFRLTGTIPEPDIDLDLGLIDFDEPITVDLERSEDIAGYTVGLGANAIAPVGIIAGHPLIANTNFLYSWNELDGGNITSESLNTSFGLTYAVLAEQTLYTFSAAAGYTRLEREAIRDLEFAGQDILLITEQKLESPWSVNLAVSRSLNKRWSVGYGLAANTAGPVSHGLTVIFSPAKKK